MKMMITCLTILFVLACETSGPTPTLTESQKDLAIQSIMGYSEVRDAAISQNGQDLSLAVMVDYATSVVRAKELGDNFVRMTKSFGPGPTPGKEIGKGVFDYLITVIYPNEEIVALGAKVRFSPKITW